MAGSTAVATATVSHGRTGVSAGAPASGAPASTATTTGTPSIGATTTTTRSSATTAPARDGRPDNPARDRPALTERGPACSCSGLFQPVGVGEPRRFGG